MFMLKVIPNKYGRKVFRQIIFCFYLLKRQLISISFFPCSFISICIPFWLLSCLFIFVHSFFLLYFFLSVLLSCLAYHHSTTTSENLSMHKTTSLQRILRIQHKYFMSCYSGPLTKTLRLAWAIDEHCFFFSERQGVWKVIWDYTRVNLHERKH